MRCVFARGRKSTRAEPRAETGVFLAWSTGARVFGTLSGGEEVGLEPSEEGSEG